MSKQVKDRTIRINDIPQDGELVLKQNSKPYASIVLLVLLGCVLVYFPQTRIFGIIFIILVLTVGFLAKDQPLIRITDQYIVSYSRTDDTARLIYLDEIAKWTYREGRAGSGDVLVLYLTDGSMIGVETLYIFPVVRAMRKLAAEKEEKQEVSFKKVKDTFIKKR